MARRSFKRWWTRTVPPAVERSTYVLAATLALALLLWQWRPIPEPVVWSVESAAGARLLGAVFWLGWTVLLVSTFLINHFELFGLRQVFARLAGNELPEPEFRTPFFYRYVRHPIYLSFLLGFWAAPVMTAALYARFTSRQDDSPAMKAVAALRNQFGGHAVTKVAKGAVESPA